MARKFYQYVAQLSRNESYFCGDWFLFCKALFMASSLPSCVYLVYVAQLSRNESYFCGDWFLFCKALFMASSLPCCVYLVYSTILPIGGTLSHCLAIKASEHYPRALSWQYRMNANM